MARKEDEALRRRARAVGHQVKKKFRFGDQDSQGQWSLHGPKVNKNSINIHEVRRLLEKLENGEIK